ncbi:hypothetical protein ACKKBG_A08340 [Auxenochlorella protothecoides x Auxenochlorella symbiontica]
MHPLPATAGWRRDEMPVAAPWRLGKTHKAASRQRDEMRTLASGHRDEAWALAGRIKSLRLMRGPRSPSPPTPRGWERLHPSALLLAPAGPGICGAEEERSC